MFIEIIHINGHYDPEAQQHTPPSGANEVLPQLQYVTERAIALGGEVLYRMNLNSNMFEVASDPTQLEAAIASDPYLSGLSEESRSKVVVRPDGGLHPPTDLTDSETRAGMVNWLLENQAVTLAREDELVRRHAQTFVLGAFTMDCVLTTAKELKRRNGDRMICVDPDLCVDRGGVGFVSGSGQNGAVSIRSIYGIVAD